MNASSGSHLSPVAQSPAGDPIEQVRVHPSRVALPCLFIKCSTSICGVESIHVFVNVQDVHVNVQDAVHQSLPHQNPGALASQVTRLVLRMQCVESKQTQKQNLGAPAGAAWRQPCLCWLCYDFYNKQYIRLPTKCTPESPSRQTTSTGLLISVCTHLVW